MILGAENLSRIKLCTEVGEFVRIGRGAFLLQRSWTVRSGGVIRSENAGMSSDTMVRNHRTESPRFPPQCKSAEGESALRMYLEQWGVIRWIRR